MAKRSTQILIGVLIAVALAVVGFLALIAVAFSWILNRAGSEYDLVQATGDSGQCFRLDSETVVVQIEVDGVDGKGFEVNGVELIDGNGLVIEAIGLVNASEPPLSREVVITQELLEKLTVPNEGFFEISEAGPMPAFLLLTVRADSGAGSASGVQLEYVPGEPLLIDAIGFDLEVSRSDCALTDVAG